MYQFHYDYVLKTSQIVKLLTDPDSLVYEIKNGIAYNQCFKVNTYFISVDIQKILFIMIVQTKK